MPTCILYTLKYYYARGACVRIRLVKSADEPGTARTRKKCKSERGRIIAACRIFMAPEHETGFLSFIVFYIHIYICARVCVRTFNCKPYNGTFGRLKNDRFHPPMCRLAARLRTGVHISYALVRRPHDIIVYTFSVRLAAIYIIYCSLYIITARPIPPNNICFSTARRGVFPERILQHGSTAEM